MPRFDDQILANMSSLYSAFEHAIRIAIHDAHKSASPNKPQEPDMVAKLLLESVPYIANALRSVLAPSGITTTISSVFCHQRPMVEFIRGGGRCELGDILFVHQHRNNSGIARNNALLLQAKMCGKEKHIIAASNELVQLQLYQQWPQFKYYRTLGLSGFKRDVIPKNKHLGAQYLLIDSNDRFSAHSGMLGFPGTHCMAVWPAGKILYANNSLADELIHFFLANSGQKFFRKWESGFSDWSQVVWDILSYAQDASFNRKNIKVSNQSRHANDQISFCCSMFDGQDKFGDEAASSISSHLNHFFDFSDQPPTKINFQSDDGESGGVSIVLIETVDTKEKVDRD